MVKLRLGSEEGRKFIIEYIAQKKRFIIEVIIKDAVCH